MHITKVQPEIINIASMVTVTLTGRMVELGVKLIWPELCSPIQNNSGLNFSGGLNFVWCEQTLIE